MNRAHLLRLGRDQLSTWVPVLLMLVFALGTWWLVQNAPRFDAPSGPQPPASEPDYYMRQFAVSSYDAAGRLKSEITGVQGHHYPATDTLHVQQPRILAYDQQGHPTLATAQRAVATGDGSQVQLYGNARVVREPIARSDGRLPTPQLEFTGEYLHAFINEERVSSNQPVQLRRGQDVFTGQEFAYDKRSGVAELTGRVRGVLQAR